MRPYIDIITELFDTREIKPKWSKNHSSSMNEVASSFVIDGFRYHVSFVALGPLRHKDQKNGEWECVFELDLGYKKGRRDEYDDPIGVLGTGNAPRIFSAVLMIIEKFVSEYSPIELEFSADEESRRKLYAAMARTLSRRLPTGYKIYQEGSGHWTIKKRG